MTIYDHWLYRFLTGPLNNVAWLYILLPCVFAGGIYLTVGSGAVQFRRFGYAMKNTAGKLFRKQETAHGAITPLQAVTTALAATVGTGNIVGTSQAIAMGGYGAVFWLWMAALLGMVIKYSEVLLAVKYRERDARGDWVGGPMYYIKNGMGDKWKWLAGAFSVLAALAAFGIGNMSQANSIVGSVTDAVCAVNPDFGGQAALRWGLGIGLALLTALVLFGGIKRIGAVTEKLIPFMSVAYILMTLIVIFGNKMRVATLLRLSIGTAKLLHRNVLAGNRLYDSRTGNKHLACPLDHKGEVGKRRCVNRTARARTHYNGNLRNYARCKRASRENLAEAGKSRNSLLDSRAARIVHRDNRCAHLNRHIHNLADFLRVHLAERAADYGEILRIYKHKSAVNRAVAGHNPLRGRLCLRHIEIGASMLDKRLISPFPIHFQSQKQRKKFHGGKDFSLVFTCFVCSRTAS